MASGDTLFVFTPQNNIPTTSVPATVDSRNAHPVVDADGATDEEGTFQSVLPRNYGGGGITLNVTVAFTTAVAGNARIQTAFERMDLSALDIDADSFAAFNSGGVVAPATSGMMVQAAIAHTAGGQMDSVVAGENFRLKWRRDADGTSGTDDITTDMELVSIEGKET